MKCPLQTFLRPSGVGQILECEDCHSDCAWYIARGEPSNHANEECAIKVLAVQSLLRNA
jgi:hypothetical protein